MLRRVEDLHQAYFKIQTEELESMNPDASEVIAHDVIEIEKTFAVLCKPDWTIEAPFEELWAPKIEIVK